MNIEVIHIGENHDYSPYVDFHVPKWPIDKLYLCISLRELLVFVGHYYVQLTWSALSFGGNTFFWESK